MININDIRISKEWKLQVKSEVEDTWNYWQPVKSLKWVDVPVEE